MNFHHISVMPQETVSGLVTNRDGIYVDCTLGGAGHSHLIADMLSEKHTPETLLSFYREYYQGEKFIQVSEEDDEIAASGFLAGNQLSGWDGMKIYVTGNEERIVVSAQFDNLGKGASGAAIQCLNIMLDCDEAKGLQL